MGMLASHRNVWNTCLLLLAEQGYKLWSTDTYDSAGDFERSEWFAEKNGYTLCADNPIELTRLAAIYEFKKPQGVAVPYWWVIKGGNLIGELEENAIRIDDNTEN